MHKYCSILLSKRLHIFQDEWLHVKWNKMPEDTKTGLYPKFYFYEWKSKSAKSVFVPSLSVYYTYLGISPLHCNYLCPP